MDLQHLSFTRPGSELTQTLSLEPTARCISITYWRSARLFTTLISSGGDTRLNRLLQAAQFLWIVLRQIVNHVVNGRVAIVIK